MEKTEKTLLENRFWRIIFEKVIKKIVSIKPRFSDKPKFSYRKNIVKKVVNVLLN